MSTTSRRIFASRTVLCFLWSVLLFASCKLADKPADIPWNEFVAPFRHWVEMDGYRMRYIDLGEGKPIVMIHGFADSSYCWHENVRPLMNAGFRVVLVDMPGLGQSDIPPMSFNPTAQNLGEEILKLANKLGLQTFSLVGSSMGGGVSLYLSGFHSDRVDRTVVIDPACFPQKKMGFLALMDLGGEPGIQFMGRWSVKMGLKDVFYHGDVVTDILVDEYSRPFAKPGYKKYLIRLLDAFSSEESAGISEHLGEIRVPLLIVWGDRDKWVPPAFGPRLNKIVPGSKYVSIKDAGHLPHEELPDVVNPILVGFMKSSGAEEKTP
jgi:pimeloyl-ACP methyl ester carboxylesterase